MTTQHTPGPSGPAPLTDNDIVKARQTLIKLRDRALGTDDFRAERSLILSYAIKELHVVLEEKGIT